MLAGPDCVLKLPIAAQIVSPPLKADGCPPSALALPPVYAGDAAGIVAPYGFGPQHLYAGAVHVGQPSKCASAGTAAAGGMAAAEAAGLDRKSVV